ncbi:MAG: hypothetical protein MRY32_04620 [Rickettsiales bacterium]|nr:hypothetical protein [Rickettsiales bacterium]
MGKHDELQSQWRNPPDEVDPSEVGMTTSAVLNNGDAGYKLFKKFTDTGLKMDSMFSPWSYFTKIPGPFEHFLKNNGNAQGSCTAGWMEYIGQMYALGDDMRSFTSMMMPPPIAMMAGQFGLLATDTHREFSQKFNDNLLTHNDDGSLNRVYSTHVRKLFEPGKEDQWPQIFLTSNHAMSATHEDVAGLMTGLQKLAKDSFGLKPNLIRRIDKGAPEEDPAKEGVGPKTMIISAVSARPNAWLNGSALLRRLIELRVQHDRNPHQFPDQDSEMSPAAIRLAKFMLRMMVEEKDIRRVDPFGTERMADIIADGQEPVTLRSDARAIAQHIRIAGYSKGGNTVTDAMRYLVSELKATRANGEPAFVIRHKENEPLKEDERDYGDAQGAASALGKWDIASIVRNIGLLSIAAGEVPLTHEEKEYGIRRINILNDKDVVASHFSAADRKRPELFYGRHDDFHLIGGVGDELGHGPDFALGTISKDGKEESGYIMSKPNGGVRDKLRCYFASMFDKVAVQDLVIIPEFEKDGKHYDAQVEIELAPGVTFDQAEKKLLPALNDAVYGNGKKVSQEEAVSFYTDLDSRCLRMTGWKSGMDMSKLVSRIKEAFETLGPNDAGNDVLISKNAMWELDNYEREVAQTNHPNAAAIYAESVIHDRMHDATRFYPELAEPQSHAMRGS